MAGRKTHGYKLSSFAAGSLWVVAIVTAWAGPRRAENVLVAAATTATIVNAIQRAHASDVSEAHWSGLAAGRQIGGQSSAGEAC